MAQDSELPSAARIEATEKATEEFRKEVIILREELTVHLEEIRPGLGILDYQAYFNGLAALDEDIPLMIEHVESEE